jgi:Mrp family chromosome partitioning ATPase
VLFVVRANKVSPEKVYSALKDLSFSNTKFTGFVLNATNETNVHYYYGRYGKRRYGYGYGYGYGHSHYRPEALSANDYEYKSEK